MTTTNNSPLVSLVFAPVDTDLKVISTSGGSEFQRKIASLGIYPDEEIKIIERHSQGALVIKVKGTSLAVGHGMSRKIKVKVIQ
jgi:ferrous iron transport protein A